MTLFRKEVLENRRRKLYGEVIIIQPLSFKILTYVFLFVTLIIMVFLGANSFNRKETVTGYIAPEQGLSVIRANKGGRLGKIAVNVGDKVSVGDILFEVISDVDTQGGSVGMRRIEILDRNLVELDQQRKIIVQKYATEKRRLNAQIEQANRELKGLVQRQKLQQEAVKLGTEQYEKIKRLTRDEVTSQLELDRAHSNDIAQRLGLDAIVQAIVVKEGVLAESEYALENLQYSEAKEKSQIRVQIDQFKENRTGLEVTNGYLLRSPISGKVSAVQGSLGQSLTENAPVVTVEPEDAQLQAILLAPSRTIGFLKLGQEVNLLVDAFPYQKFGIQKGRIVEISSTPYRPGELNTPLSFEESAYRIVVSLNKQTILAYGNEMEFKSGMTLKGDLITDRRSLVQWIFDPIFALKRT